MTGVANDPLAPKAGADADLMVGPLAAVTLIGADADAVSRFYRETMEMTERPTGSLSEADKAKRRALMGLPTHFDWTEHVFHRPGTPEVPLLRVMASAQAGPPIRPNMEARLEGGLSVGFATRDMDRAVAQATEQGVKTTAGVVPLPMTRADGSAYEALEAHFIAPDEVYALAVGRPADLSPVGPVEEGQNNGGPAYSAQIINHGDRCLAFYTEVLGYEARRRVPVTSSGPEGGLGLPPDTAMIFMQVFAPGTSSGYLVFLDFAEAGLPNPPERLRPPHRGVVMWSFRVRDLDAVLDRARDFGAPVFSGPLLDADPLFGARRVATVATPNGFLVELLEE